MKEKDFHKKIEKYLTEEERLNKEKDWDLIVKRTGYESDKKAVKFNFVKGASVLSIFLIVLIIPIIMIVQNNNVKNQAGISNPQTISHTSQSFLQSKGEIIGENAEITTPEFCIIGIIMIENDNNKYFYSIDGIYKILLTKKTPIEKYNSSVKPNFNDLISNTPVFAMIVTENNKIFFPNNQIGDLLKIIIK
ncbi:MAG: hypothetical protein IJF75_04185 [Clostridia bacterium]|nr:hypothetical protein [Clostridia bacterium]